MLTHSLHRVLQLTAIAALMFVAPKPAAGQQIRGTVVFADSVTRARGIVILASDARGATVARALTNERGEFLLGLPGAGRYTARALHIGSRPTIVAPFDVGPDETRSMRIVLGNDPVDLIAVRVKGDDVCGIHDGSGKLVVDIWNQVRAALTATQLTSDGLGLQASLLEYTRTESDITHVIQDQKSLVKDVYTTHAFVSLPADTLAARGYVIPDSTGINYFAPDPDALLSESFAAQHCFHIEASSREHPEWVGIGFRPARDRRGIRDIRGTLWLDRTSAYLRRLDYAYTNVDYAIAAGTVGSFIDFLALPSGEWIVRSWAIRMPIVSVDQPEKEAGRNLFTHVQLSGGAVLQILREGDVLYSVPGSVVDLHFVEHDPVVRGVGTVVTLAGTSYRGVADSTSHARLESVLPGNYLMHARVPVMERVDVPHLQEVLSVPVDTSVVFRQLHLPTANDLVRAACGDTVVDDSALVFGIVRDSLGKPLVGATVQLKWLNLRAAPMQRAPFLRTESDSSGLWLICRAPPKRDMWVTVSVGKHELQRVPVRLPDRWRIVRFDLPNPTPQQP